MQENIPSTQQDTEDTDVLEIITIYDNIQESLQEKIKYL